MIAAYSILGAAILFIGVLLWKNKDRNWGYIIFGSLVFVLITIILLNSKELGKYQLIFAGKNYQLSSTEVKSMFKENIENFIDVYNSYLVVDTFDLSEESQDWKIEIDKGVTYLLLRLSHVPIEKTVEFKANIPFGITLRGNYFKNGYYAIPYEGVPQKTKEEIINFYKSNKVYYEVRYLKKNVKST